MSLADIIAVGIVFVPIVYAGLFVLATVGIGPLSSEVTKTGDNTASIPEIVTLERTESVAYQTDPKRDRWKYHAVLGLFLLPFGWGLALLVYALRVRKRSRYIVTDRRIIEESPNDVVSYDYDDISQVQAGARILESLLDRGNVQFNIDNRQLVTLGWMQNAENVAGIIEKQAS